MREWKVWEVGGCEAPRQAQKRSSTHLLRSGSLLEHLPRVRGQVLVGRAMEATGGECQRGGFSGRERE